jgi:hypothetical protein
LNDFGLSASPFSDVPISGTRLFMADELLQLPLEGESTCRPSRCHDMESLVKVFLQQTMPQVGPWSFFSALSGSHAGPKDIRGGWLEFERLNPPVREGLAHARAYQLPQLKQWFSQFVLTGVESLKFPPVKQ